ncbi:hypothetical protein [Protofrankia coriariae]|uniref:hypothetical protein n=1 Tax=Protofrankia coriariae TaxID=1562887 RepID=UPI00138F1078|nr:hypothetical protein [Protofrankia coriariae]
MLLVAGAEHLVVTLGPIHAPPLILELLASLDAPAEPNDALTRAAARLDSVIERR